jgi:hypothetical protein
MSYRTILVHCDSGEAAALRLALACDLAWKNDARQICPQARAPLAHAPEFDAKLIIMSVYGRSRLREWMPGAVGPAVLTGVPMPIFIAH